MQFMAFRTVGYYENWAQYRQAGGKFFPNQINPGLFTHINFAFGLFGFVSWSVDPTPTRTGPQRYTGDYSVQPVEWNDQTVLYPQLNALKQQNPNLKTLLSIGGWSMNSADDVPTAGNPHPYGPYTYQLFSKMAADPNGRKQFINSAIAYAHKYEFDGIDIDWEYPGDATRGGTPNDYANFLALVQQFRATAGPDFLLTMAAPAILTGGMPQWLASCAQSLSWLNIMAYDYHGAFDDPVKVGTGVNAPLLQDSFPNGSFFVKHSVESYLGAGIPGGKITLGLPTYGRSYTVANPSLLGPHPAPGLPFSGPGPAGPSTAEAGSLAYYEIVQQLLSGNMKRGFDLGTLTPYAYNQQSGEWVSYDDEQSIGYKVTYLLQKGLGGAMFWAIDNDAFPSIGNALHKAIGRGHIADAHGAGTSNGFPLITTVKEIFDNPSTAPPLPGPTPPPPPPPVGTQNWMAALPDNIKISKLTIPGTHDSCAIGDGSYLWYAQQYYLIEQLQRGIRFLDIRCRQINDTFAIHHYLIFLNLYFQDVIAVCKYFLQANSKECILMLVKNNEYTDQNNKLTFQQVFDNYVNAYPNLFYLSDDIPNLGDVRGKIVILRRFPANDTHHGILRNYWPDNTSFSDSYKASNNENVSLYVQDAYNVPAIWDIGGKYSFIWDTLSKAAADSTETLFLNYTSGSSGIGLVYPNYIAQQVHLKLWNDLGTYGPQWPNRLGVIVMDFPDDLLMERVISMNDRLKAHSGLHKERSTEITAGGAG
jgi:chitinase